jgi:hypothetical protein
MEAVVEEVVMSKIVEVVVVTLVPAALEQRCLEGGLVDVLYLSLFVSSRIVRVSPHALSLKRLKKFVWDVPQAALAVREPSAQPMASLTPALFIPTTVFQVSCVQARFIT